MTLTAKERLFGVDTETFGLDVKDDEIIEFGARITDLDLNTIAEFHALLWTPWHAVRLEGLKAEAALGKKGPQIVLDMHTKSGLLDEARENGRSYDEVQNSFLNWCDENAVNGEDSLLGSSVHFDRAFLEEYLPGAAARLFRRNIDISSIKELVVRYRPDLAERLYKEVPLRKEHRVLPDLDDTLAEHRFYLDNFLRVTP